MERFNSVHEGLAAMKLRAQNRKVCALLTFQTTGGKMSDAAFLFESFENPIAQLVRANPDLRPVGATPAEVPSYLSARETALSVTLSLFGPVELDIKPHGHAEEFLIRNFHVCCGIVPNIRDVTIYQSQSPCTLQDRAPSDSMPGWPPSCTAKYQQLAAAHPAYHFTICFSNAFGVLAGNGQIEKVLKVASGNLPNLAFAAL